MNKIYNAAIIGCGSRGWKFGCVMMEQSDKFKVVFVNSRFRFGAR